MKTLAILGSGHLGQQIAHYAISDGHYDKVVFFDDFSRESYCNGYQILGGSDKIEDEFKKNAFDYLLIGIGYKHLEKRKYFFDFFNGKIPFGKMHSTNKEVIHLANLIGRTPNSIALRLVNFASVDPVLKARGIKGMDGGTKIVQPIWDEFYTNQEELVFLSEKIDKLCDMHFIKGLAISFAKLSSKRCSIYARPRGQSSQAAA